MLPDQRRSHGETRRLRHATSKRSPSKLDLDVARAAPSAPASRPYHSTCVSAATSDLAAPAVVAIDDRALAAARVRRDVNSSCLAAKYSSMVWWKSRWSRVRLVKTAVWNMHSVDAPQRQRVRRDLHCHMRAAQPLPARETCDTGRAIRASCSRPAAASRPDGIRWCRPAQWFGPAARSIASMIRRWWFCRWCR